MARNALSLIVCAAGLAAGCPSHEAPPRTARPAVDWHGLEQALMSVPGPGGSPVRIADTSQWERRRDEIRRRILSVLGPFRAGPTGVSARRLSHDHYRGLTRYKITYPVEHGESVKAWLLVPPGIKDNAPALVCLHSTTSAGKDDPIGLVVPPSGPFADELATRGYVVLVPDMITAGERVRAGERPFYTDAFYRDHPNWSATGKMVWDCMCAIHVLEHLPFVDPERIGCIGHSLGGHVALYTAALDTRLKATVSSCGWELFQADWQSALRFSRTAGFVYVPGLRQHFRERRTPYDHHEVLALVAPRAFLDLSAENDATLPRSETNARVVTMVKQVYRLYGREGKVAAVQYEQGHAFSRAMAKEAAAFFDRELRPRSR